MATSRIRKTRRLVAAVAVYGLACASTPVYQPPPVVGVETATSTEVQAHHRAYQAEGERNAVLNLMRLAVAALDSGRTDLAESALDQIIIRIGASDAGSPEARRARSLWNAESEKRFKGEPHERAMVYYYRGLLYLSAGDYENARASFRAGQLEDSMAENPEHSQDFASLYFLSGWASHCMHDSGRASEAFGEAERVRGQAPAVSTRDNLIVVVETGTGPRKTTSGAENSSLEYEGGLEGPAVFGSLEHQPLVIQHMENLLEQATGRGRREIEEILAAHAKAKRINREMGEVLTTAGTTGVIVSNQQNSPEAALVSLVIALFGLAQQGIASQMQAEADTRTWESLPGQIAIATAAAKPGLRSVAIGDDSASVSVPSDGCALVWARSGDGQQWSMRTLGRAVSALR